ncbi:MAG TPA: hypothetical protein VK756_09585 [Solirubrobacteraceae bacterium]|jgi:hypothetical protein|nr:hypothetical protein [Solirubrobacteraceae bacterium]
MSEPARTGTGGRAVGLGPRGAARGATRRVPPALAVAVVVLVLVLVAALSGALGSGGVPAGAHRSSGAQSRWPIATGARTRAAAAAAASASDTAGKYGGLPSWLPKPKVRVNRLLTATPAHPALSIQGETVAVELPRLHLLATAVGPKVPEEGRFPVPASTPCTFIVTFASASGTIALRPAAFAFRDDLGHVHHPRLTAIDGGPPPRSIARGQTVSLKLHDVLPTGDGGLTWAPAGGRALVAWDYTVEID